ncbi:MAG: hypothetical protein U0800_21455 [Isosphaeraceae bacterium]
MFANMDDGASDRLRNPSTRYNPGRRHGRPDEGVAQAIGRTRDWLLDRQDPQGFWQGEPKGIRSSNPNMF